MSTALSFRCPRRRFRPIAGCRKRLARSRREHGALEFRECIADDVKVGKLISFPRSVKLKPSETVMFSWITYKSRAHRDRVNAKVMKDKRIAGMDLKSMPFDAKRMIYGGFKVIVEA